MFEQVIRNIHADSSELERRNHRISDQYRLFRRFREIAEGGYALKGPHEFDEQAWGDLFKHNSNILKGIQRRRTG